EESLPQLALAAMRAALDPRADDVAQHGKRAANAPHARFVVRAARAAACATIPTRDACLVAPTFAARAASVRSGHGGREGDNFGAIAEMRPARPVGHPGEAEAVADSSRSAAPRDSLSMRD